MYSDRRIPDDLYSDAWNAQAYETEPRRPRRRRDYHRGRHDVNDVYDQDNGPSFPSQSGYTECHDASSQHYYDASSQPYEEPQHYEADYRSRPSCARSYNDSYRGSRRGRGVHSARNYGTYLSGPSMTINYQRPASRSPSRPPIPLSPSPEYLSIAAEPSEIASSPARKLIILDLNGTLLLRLRSVGAAYPRPFMPAFRDFLLTPETRRWLDVMVWSSAQPHNVDRMVQRCFFDERLGQPLPEPEGEKNEHSEAEEKKDKWDGMLAAVWARDTLGLSSKDYSRKSQTTKDLEKPWATLSGEHSARTTFLLDDSPAKARLQPFNHVCINEYTSALRDHDMSVKRRAQTSVENIEASKQVDGLELGQQEQNTTLVDGGEKEVEGSIQSEKVRKKKKNKKTKKKQAKINAAAQQDPTQETQKYDSTLLAVIGILNTLKHESNVAGWIRAGGLWAGKTPPLVTKESVPYVEFGKRQSSPTDAEVDEAPPASSPELSPSQVKRQRSTGSEIDGGDMKRTRFSAEQGVSDETPVAAGNDAQTVGVVENANGFISLSASNGLGPSQDDPNQEAPRTTMWFEDEETFRLWVGRGQAALRDLGIEERDGICCE